MHQSDHNLLVILAVGLVAGWLAGLVIRGSRFGPIGDLIVGWLGALIGHWLLLRFDVHLGAGLVATTMNAMIGAIVLLLTVRLLNGRGILYKRRWGRGW